MVTSPQGQKDYDCECRRLTPGADLKCFSNDPEFVSIKSCFKLATKGKHEILNIPVVENVRAPVTSSDHRSSVDPSLRHEDHDPSHRLRPEGLRILPVSAGPRRHVGKRGHGKVSPSNHSKKLRAEASLLCSPCLARCPALMASTQSFVCSCDLN